MKFGCQPGSARKGSSMSPVTHDTVLSRVRNKFVHESDIVQRLRTETGELPNSGMMLDPEAGAMLAVLARAIQAKRTLDIGVFTGFSSLTVALNAPDAHITALVVDAYLPPVTPGKLGDVC